MSFKNAFKLLLSRFRYVWAILAYLLVMFIVLLSLGLTFLLPVIRALSEAGVGEMLNTALIAFLNGGTIVGLFSAFQEVIITIGNVFATDSKTFVNSMLFVVLVATIAYRFIMGLYELPLVSVIQGFMSDNARYSYMPKYVSWFSKSVRFSLIKMLVMTIYDALMYVIVFFIGRLFGRISVILAPTALSFALLIFLSLRYSLISAWSPSVVVEDKKIFPALWFSVKYALRHFGSLFSLFFIVWVLAFALNIFVGIFTFGAGLMVSVPMTMYFINLVNMTFFYGRTGKSYYLDGAVFTQELRKK